MNDDKRPADPIRRIDFVTAMYGVTPRTVYSRIARGEFPAPDIFDGRNGWRHSRLEAHLAATSAHQLARTCSF